MLKVPIKKNENKKLKMVRLIGLFFFYCLCLHCNSGFGQTTSDNLDKREVNKHRYQLGLEFIADGDYDAALSQFNNILSSQPNDLASLRRTADVYSAKKCLSKLISVEKRIVDLDTSDISARLDLAAAYQNKGLPDSAELHYRWVLDHDSSNVAALVGLSETCLQGKKQERVVAALERLRKENPENQQVLFGLAKSYTATGEWAKAVAADKEILKGNGDNTGVRLHLAQVLTEKHDFVGARAVYDQLLKQQPNSSAVLRGVAELAQKENDIMTSEAAYRKLLAKNPADLQSLMGLAEIYYQRRDFSQSEYYLRQALKVDANNPVVLSKLNELREKKRCRFCQVMQYWPGFILAVVVLLSFSFLKSRANRKRVRLSSDA